MTLRLIKKIKLKKSYFIVAIITMFLLSVSVTNPTIANDEVQNEVISAPKASAGPYKAALMVGGDETDLGFSYVAIQAISMLEVIYGWDISISRQVAYTDQYRIASEYGEDEYDVVFLVGGQFIETIYFEGLVTNYNDTLFVMIPGIDSEYVDEPDNVVGLHPAFQTEGHYLAGVLAGQMTETDRLGVVFGEWYDYLAMEFYAFKAGVESVNDDALLYVRVAGDWGDAALGKQITETLIETKNVDIVVQVADTTGRGVIAACVEADIAVIGTVADQASLALDNTMTSIGMDTQLLMEIVAKRIENGTAMDVLGGTTWDIPIGNYLYPYHNYNDTIPQSVKDIVDDAKAGIANGSIVVPRITTDDPPTDPVSIPVPPTITTTSQTIDEDNIDLHWTSTLETGTYHVYIDDTEFGNTTATTKNVEFVGNGTYTITVTAKNSLGESPKSESITITVAIPPGDPDTPDDPVIPGYNNVILIFTLIASIGILAYVTKKKSKLF